MSSMNGFCITLILVVGLAGVFSAGLGLRGGKGSNPDEVLSLPGLAVQPKFKHYSGYLKASGTKKLHYWFVESQFEPETDPVVLWMNGGPGCSSLDGLLSELGPFHLRDDGKTVYMNPYSWNNAANVIFLEAPAGVGFSYSDDKNYTTDDDQVSMDNYLALQDFFTKFPQFSKNPFFVTGESYGGVYVPTLSMRILEGNATINMQGFAVGNGLSSYALNDNSLMYFGYYHGLFGTDLWSQLQCYCCNASYCNFHDNAQPQCSLVVGEAMNIVYNIGLDIYNLYDDCAGGIPPHATVFKVAMSNLFRNYKIKYTPLIKKPPKLRVTPPCVNVTSSLIYLNNPDVRKALHIPTSVQDWDICSGVVGAQYVRKYQTLYNQYQTLVKHYRIMVYNGDIDMACNFLGDEWFVESLKLDKSGDRREWVSNKQIAGFVQDYTNVTLVTIKGAGHMVPQDKPAQALKMFTAFIKNTPLN
ncbi:lysosomal protective protein-like [Anneissia japonica]|uniref:lysosomal protective protein-like n=1 Tax=Anneissia japonica TaxID=1529436 RepID=UPI0014254CCC|nr:lysosomal protective protein-like [Anneissia japonica]